MSTHERDNSPTRTMLDLVVTKIKTLTLRRLATLICGVILLISGLGTLTYWTMLWSGNEIFVPFGLSTFRSLHWPLCDMFLLKNCLLSALLLLADHHLAYKASVLVGCVFVFMGLLGLALDSMPQWREEVAGAVDELQPMFLNLWFVGFGSVMVGLGAGGFVALDRFRSVPIVQWLKLSGSSVQML
jgi:hypothetical protein